MQPESCHHAQNPFAQGLGPYTEIPAKIGRALIALTIVAAFVTFMVLSSRAEDKSVHEDTTMNNAELINRILRKMRSGEKIEPAEFQQFVDLQNNDLKTGPAVGTKVPDFALADQNGKQWRVHELMGPKGMLLVFTRSADW